MDTASYNHLYGVMRSRETELLDAAQLRSLATMREVNEVSQVVADSPFLRHFSTAFDEASLEAGIAAELHQLTELIDRYAPEDRLRDLLLVPLDLYNIKVALRAWARQRGALGVATDGRAADSPVDADDLYGLPGTRSIERIRAAVLGEADNVVSLAGAGDRDAASRALADAIERSLHVYSAAGASGQALELALDRLSRLFRVAAARPTPNASVDSEDAEAEPDGVAAALQAEADVAAAELVVRGSAGGLRWDIARWGLLDMPNMAELEDLYASEPQEWAGRLGPFSGEMRRVLGAIAEGENAAATLHAAQHRLGATMVSWLLRPPCFSFAYAYARKKLDDLANLRLLCLTRLRGVDQDQGAQRIRFGMAAA